MDLEYRPGVRGLSRERRASKTERRWMDSWTAISQPPLHLRREDKVFLGLRLCATSYQLRMDFPNNVTQGRGLFGFCFLAQSKTSASHFGLMSGG
jgi:hypothetical protein